jgi:hypothetical protein
MIIPETRSPTLWTPKAIPSDKDYELLDRALKETEDQWVNDFIKRLNYRIEDIRRKK